MKSAGTGIGIFDVVGIVFIILKLVGVINWSWWWVLAPIWIPVVLVLLILFLVWLTDDKYRHY